jgi:hypothetical protein
MTPQLQPWLLPYAKYLLQLYASQGIRLTSSYRSYSEQLQLWLNRSRNPYPVAPPGLSYHQYGRAFDVDATIGVLRSMGATWRSWGGTWNESDPIHFQA